LFAEIADRNYPIPVLNTLSYISNQESARVTEGLMEEKDHVLVCGIEESEYSLRYLLNASLRVGAESRTMETIMTQFFMVHAENKELSDFLFSVILRKYNSLVVNVCLSEECCVWTLSRVLKKLSREREYPQQTWMEVERIVNNTQISTAIFDGVSTRLMLQMIAISAAIFGIKSYPTDMALWARLQTILPDPVSTV
jgi:hypothetical protein